MLHPRDRLSPRQRECLRLVHERQATSKEIAAELGISKSTVDGYIAEAVEVLGARDRREAARIAYGDAPPAASGGDTARVPDPLPAPAGTAATKSFWTTRPWRTRQQPTNTLSVAQTLGWIALIAIGSLFALTLAMIFGNGVPPVVHAVQHSFGRLTH